jgi:predicted alpha/beta-hydrolase family hydrolase
MLVLGHGASGTAASMRPWVAALAARDVAARAIDLPKSNAARAVGVFRSVLAGDPGTAIGGHSYGGRVASILASAQAVRALVLLSYPLHRPGHPDEVRADHWPRIRCPVLMLSGERDPFANLARLQREARKLADAELVTYPGLGHGLLPVVDDACDRIAAFLR